MPLNFVQTLEVTSRRLVWRRHVAAACWTLAGVTAAMVMLAAIDRAVGVHHVAGRITLTAAFAVAAAAIVWQSARRIGRRPTPLDVALLVERDEPALRSLLASGLELSGQRPDDVTAGSPELRRGVVLRAELVCEEIDVNRTATRRSPLAAAVCAAALAIACVAALAVWKPNLVAIGAARLVNPLASAEWPRRHDLTFVDPPRVVAIGYDFRTMLRDRQGRLPPSVVVEYRTRRQGRWFYESQRYAPEGELVEVTWPNVQGAFEYRAEGGDHRHMPWQRVAVEPAPKIESLQVTIRPPSYTGWPERSTEPPLRVLRGSTLAVAARTNVPVATAQLESPGTTPIPLSVGADAQLPSAAEWLPSETAEWSFRLTTPSGLVMNGVRPLQVEVLEDEPPTTAIIQPAGELYTLPTARLELAIEASDDVGLSGLQLRLQPMDGSDSSVEPIEIPLPQRSTMEAMVEPQRVHQQLDLSELGIEATTDWELYAVARDLAGNEARAMRPLRLHVVSREEYAARLEARLARLRASIERARDYQREALDRVASWSPRSDEASRPEREAVDEALSWQRRTGQQLTGSEQGAMALVEKIAADLHRSGLATDARSSQLEPLREALGRLARDVLPSAEERLGQLARQLELNDDHRPKETTEKVDRLRAEAERRQRESLAALQNALSRLEESGQLADQETGESAAQTMARESATRGAEPGGEGGTSIASDSAAAGATPGSAEGPGGGTPTQIDRAAIARLVRDRWGRLPQRQQDELLQPLSEEFVPEYAQATEAYFRALAEPPSQEDGARD